MKNFKFFALGLLMVTFGSAFATDASPEDGKLLPEYTRTFTDEEKAVAYATEQSETLQNADEEHEILPVISEDGDKKGSLLVRLFSKDRN